jgi:glycosyltransferase involved in cell wall biosynthesis
VLALRLRQGGDWAGRLLYRLALSQTLRADRLLTVSEFSRREILASLPVEPARLVVVPPGVRPQGGASAARRPAAMPGGPFALTVGINKPHKNLGMLLEAWRLLGSAPPLHLVVVGPESARYPSTATLAQRADARGVTTLGRVSEDELEWLYRNATLLVFPSLYEGFGSPVLEALAHGLPAVVSDIPALREVAGAAARFVPPHDPTAWAGEVRSLAGDPAARETLSAAGLRQARTLTYSRTAAEVMAVLRDVAGEEARA